VLSQNDVAESDLIRRQAGVPGPHVQLRGVPVNVFILDRILGKGEAIHACPSCGRNVSKKETRRRRGSAVFLRWLLCRAFPSWAAASLDFQNVKCQQSGPSSVILIRFHLGFPSSLDLRCADNTIRWKHFISQK